MGSYGHVHVDGRALLAFKDDVEPTFMLLFHGDDLKRSIQKGADRPYAGRDPEGHFEVVEFVAPASVVRERLDALGVSRRAAGEALAHLVAERLEHHQHFIQEGHFSEDIERQLTREDGALRQLDMQSWAAQAATRLRAGDQVHEGRMTPGTLGWLVSIWDYVDPRLVLRAVVEAMPDSTIALDITDLVEGGWLQDDIDPQEAALEHFGWVLANGSPAIVLAEGRTDIEVLRTAMNVLRPHLRGFIRFADFEVKPEGGAAALVRTIRAFAAAGVANAVIAVFDNDTAAADSLRLLGADHLPKNYSVLRYPDTDIARAYPTLGPSGLQTMNVNGLACGIEMYLGSDVLTQDDGNLVPVQWKGYVASMGQYQGELTQKAFLLDRFRYKAQVASKYPSKVASQDWEPFENILALIVETLSDMRSG